MVFLLLCVCSCWFECSNPIHAIKLRDITLDCVCSCWFECSNPIHAIKLRDITLDCVCSSVVERCPDKTEAVSSILTTRTGL